MAELINTTSQSITLQLPTPERDDDCNNVSLATVHFTVYYGTIDGNGISECAIRRNSCLKLVSITNHTFIVLLS